MPLSGRHQTLTSEIYIESAFRHSFRYFAQVLQFLRFFFDIFDTILRSALYRAIQLKFCCAKYRAYRAFSIMPTPAQTDNLTDLRSANRVSQSILENQVHLIGFDVVGPFQNLSGSLLP